MSFQRKFVILLCLVFLIAQVVCEDASLINKCPENPEEYITPVGCEYYDDLLRCSGIFPNRFPKGIKSLEFYRTKINYIDKYTFYGCKNVTKIIISQGELNSIKKEAFHYLDNLKILDLSKNYMRLDKMHVEEGVFDKLSSLEELFIHNNYFPRNTSYRDDLFYGLHNLHTLFIQGIAGGEDFGPGFEQLQKLKLLEIYDGLNEITNTTFLAFNYSTIRELYLNTDIKRVEPLAFSHFTCLQVLNIYYTTYSDISILSEAWYGLQYTHIKTITIHNAWYDESLSVVPEFLDDAFFSHLGKSNVTEFFLRTSTICFISADLSLVLPHVENLTIVNEQTYALKDIVAYLPKLSNLKRLKLGFFGSKKSNSPAMTNVLHESQSNTFNRIKRSNQRLILEVPPSLTSVVISLPKFITFLPTLFIFDSHQLRYVSVTFSNLIFFPTVVFRMPPIFPLSVVLSNNMLIDFDSESFESSIVDGLQIHMLDLSNNLLQLAGRTPFKWLSHLTSLSLDHNRIKKLGPTLFNGLQGLKILSAKYNNIREAKNCFTNMTMLETIDLSHNSLRSVDFSVATLHNLSKLNLEYNLIAFLGHNTMEELNVLHHKSDIQVHLGGNPLICSCDTLSFIKWILNSHVVPLKGESGFFEKPACFHEDRVIEIKEFQNVTLLRMLQVKCASHKYLMWTGLITGVIILGLCFSVCIYRHRWDLRFICLRITRKRKVFQETYETKKYDFDAFVAFDQEDYEWVSNELMPNLECPEEHLQNEQGPFFKLCVHNRDWAYGTRIEENIIESVLNSRKTILVLTPSFVQSNWCLYELEMARTRCFEEGRDIIIVIMLESVPVSAMNNTLQTLIKRVTYLEWPCHDVDRVVFWEKLRRSLQKPSTKAPVCECGRKVYKD